MAKVLELVGGCSNVVVVVVTVVLDEASAISASEVDVEVGC